MIDADNSRIIVRPLSRRDYLSCLREMREFTAARGPDTADEIWLVEHSAVFTQGLAGKAEHLLNPGKIPVVPTERGGQVTYHGPGQVLAYLLIDIRRRQITIKDLVWRMEQALIDCLTALNIDAQRLSGAPGVYLAGPRSLAGSKIAAVGLKVSRGCTFHGLALNVDMDLTPFNLINPCGYPGLHVVDLKTVAQPAPAPAIEDIAAQLALRLSSVITSRPTKQANQN